MTMVPKTLSGPAWVAQFPTSKNISDLAEPFQTNVKNFVAALKAAGATVTVAATLRSKERAHLMHWSFAVAKEALDPMQVPSMDGVNIEWVHPTSPASKTAAGLMVTGYDIVFRPALASRHSEGNAIDMDISWATAPLTIQNAAGNTVTISSGPKDGGNAELQAVGKTYGVIKLLSDPPHWSSDGH